MHFLITGGAGFIGCNAANYFLQQGHTVTVFDNLSRRGTASNLAWLQLRHAPDRLHFIEGDVRSYEALSDAVRDSDVVLHLAGQVAVTTSVRNPRDDFAINALGTFNMLEAVRNHRPQAIVINASTNKVYGGMEEIGVVEHADRYAYADRPFGIDERAPLDFHSPYGCSKGAGDQYTLDYHRIYGLKTLSYRQSCIYGPRQFGIEDQGWVAYFVIAAAKGWPITIFGDGKQVRDVLHVHDLLAAYTAGIARIDAVAGQAFNIGGGPANTLAIWRQFAPLLTELVGHPVAAEHADWRPGDQKVFIADIRKAQRLLDWQPTIAPRDGIAALHAWVNANLTLFG